MAIVFQEEYKLFDGKETRLPWPTFEHRTFEHRGSHKAKCPVAA
jgi:hypothetical protein